MDKIRLYNKIICVTFVFWVVFFTLDMVSTWYFLSFLPTVVETNPCINFFIGVFGVPPGLIIFGSIVISTLTAVNYFFYNYNGPWWKSKIIVIIVNIGLLCANLYAFINNMRIIYQLTSLL
ncbi:MAG: hypothetical protein ACTSQY_05805 [Candidatus Odinarchaeia archaeon]